MKPNYLYTHIDLGSIIICPVHGFLLNKQLLDTLDIDLFNDLHTDLVNDLASNLNNDLNKENETK